MVKKNAKNPAFGEYFDFVLKNRSSSRLEIECLDWNQFEGNKLLGAASLDCAKLVIDEK